MKSKQPRLSANSYEEARKLAEAFEEVRNMEAWAKLRRFVAFLQLSAGQRALAQPEEVQHWKSWSEGVEFMLTVVDNACEQVEEFEEENEEKDDEILAYLDFGGSDPL